MSQDCPLSAAARSSLPMAEDVRRARVLYHYLQPIHLESRPVSRPSSSHLTASDNAPRLTDALAPFVQLASIRCHAQRAFIDVTDRDTQYFLAEASRSPLQSPGDSTEGSPFQVDDELLFLGCGGVPKEGKLCEITIQLKATQPNKYPFFIVDDIAADARFSHMSIVKGPPYFRFYAGTPITTRAGVNIGTVSIMDTRVRHGLTDEEREFLGWIAKQVMFYLEINRDAIEGKRAKRMSDALNHFVEGKSNIQDMPSMAGEFSDKPDLVQPSELSSEDSGSDEQDSERKAHDGQNVDSKETNSHSRTFGRAANLLREAFELDENSGVLFIGASQGLTHTSGTQLALVAEEPKEDVVADDDNSTTWPLASPAHQINMTTSYDPIIEKFSRPAANAAPVLALSTHDAPFMREGPSNNFSLQGMSENRIDQEILRELLKRYPKGKLWLFDHDGAMSESDDARSYDRRYGRETARRLKTSSWTQTETKLLTSIWPGVRQLLFSPLWDAASSRWASACFVFSHSETRVLTSSTELSYLNSFGKSIMAECSRLDTLLSDRQKADFIGSISHELRSPLHGILASVEFLVDTTTNAFQRSLIDTVDSCGRTLLDTINHVLDFSKINSFERNWRNTKSTRSRRGNKSRSGAKTSNKPLPDGAPPLLRLYSTCDIAAIIEEVVEGIALGKIFNNVTDVTDMTPQNRGRGASKGLVSDKNPKGGREEGLDYDPVEVILDIDREDWIFTTQPGALRRVVMNLFGNATKYTASGSIRVRLQLEDADEDKESDRKMMVLTVTDTGKGISSDFLSTKLFVPFAQENTLSPGTGLGLSIVRSIVTMLGGTVDIRSRVGEGTIAQATLPLQVPPGYRSALSTVHKNSSTESISTVSGKADAIQLLREVAQGYKVALYGLSGASQTPSKRDFAHTMARYITDWYGIEIVPWNEEVTADVIIVEERDVPEVMHRDNYAGHHRFPGLVVLCSNATRHSQAQADVSETQIKGIVEFVSKPCGPYKLAKALRVCVMNLELLRSATLNSDRGVVVNGSTDIDLLDSRSTVPKSIASDHVKISQLSANTRIAVRGTSSFKGENDTSFPFPSPDQASGFDVWETPIPTSLPTHGKDQSSRSHVSSSSPSHDARSPALAPHVLLVDDNLINLRLLKTFMKKRNYFRVDTAADGQIAVSAVKAAKEPYDIIFMDISMPVMNGFEATRQIREFEVQVESASTSMIIFLTGLASGRDQEEGLDSGCDIYITKPVSFKQVGKLLDTWERAKLEDLEEEGTPRAEHIEPGGEECISIPNAVV